MSELFGREGRGERVRTGCCGLAPFGLAQAVAALPSLLHLAGGRSATTPTSARERTNASPGSRDERTFVWQRELIARSSFVRGERGTNPPLPFGATLLCRFVRVRALLREVIASGLRCILRDDPRSVLRVVRASEVLAKESAERLRVATDLVRERLRRIRLCVRHVPSLRFFVGHVWSVARSFVRCAFERKQCVKRSRSTPSFVRSIVERVHYCHPPCRPPEGPLTRAPSACRAKRAGCAIFRSQRATYVG